MSPKEAKTVVLAEDEAGEESPPQQHLYIIRHGDRWDYENPEWNKTSPRVGDPPLSALGHNQAREVGLFLNDLFIKDGLTANDITWMSSPFLRCLQTSDNALNAMIIKEARSIRILPEYSVFEWDGKGGTWHASLPPLDERRHYFARLDTDYQSLFVPDLPEPRDVFHTRCERAVDALNQRYTFQPRTALVVVTHAAACIGLVKAATRLNFTDINPAAPCGIYRLTRTVDEPDVWKIDPHDSPTGLNGHTDHLSSMSGRTVAWNHFGDKSRYQGYSGPPTSKFAPAELREKLCKMDN